MATYITSKGDEIVSELSDLDAANVLIEHRVKGDFADSLITAVLQLRLTDKQRPWLHKLAQEALREPEPLGNFGDAGRLILERLDRGQRHVEYPKLRFWLGASGGLRTVMLSRAQGRNEGFVYVKWEGDYYGKLNGDGDYFGKNLPAEVSVAFQLIAREGDEFFAKNGRASGRCCFCGRKLTTPESLSAGYGPDCADHYRLPWGHIQVDRKFGQVNEADLDELRREFGL